MGGCALHLSRFIFDSTPAEAGLNSGMHAKSDLLCEAAGPAHYTSCKERAFIAFHVAITELSRN